MAADSDVLIISCPLTEETKGMINQDVLDALGPSGFLVNVGRGPIVNEEELVKAVLDGRIAGAGLDVYDDEPHVPMELVALDNVVLTPHIGTSTRETDQSMVALVVANLEAHFAGRPLITPVF
jgi:lactate dehydrogenase-like 2-hydroxyacid dehydrogenase